MQLNVPYCDKSRSLFGKLKSGHIKSCTLYGACYYLKGNKPELLSSTLKTKLPEIVKRKEENRIKRKLVDAARARMIKTLGMKKQERTNALLGCSPAFFKEWLGKQFDANMSWENHGDYWHIDHIKPCNTFDLSNKEERLKCFHYSNCRPLEKFANMARPKDGSDIGEDLLSPPPF